MLSCVYYQSLTGDYEGAVILMNLMLLVHTDVMITCVGWLQSILAAEGGPSQVSQDESQAGQGDIDMKKWDQPLIIAEPEIKVRPYFSTY